MTALVQARTVSRGLSTTESVPYARAMTSLPDDSALMLRYGDGDNAAFETLYYRHNDALYRYLLGLTRNPDGAADLFQEAWARVIRARASYRPTARFRTWLFRIAHNCFIDSLRRNKRYGDHPPRDPDSWAAEGPAPDEITERAQARTRMLAALDRLPQEQRDAFLLHEEGGLTVAEVAEVTGVERETAKSRLRYAASKLKSALLSAAPASPAGGPHERQDQSRE